MLTTVFGPVTTALVVLVALAMIFGGAAVFMVQAWVNLALPSASGPERVGLAVAALGAVLAVLVLVYELLGRR